MVTQTAIVFGILNIACGLLFILLALPLVQKKVPPNGLYGFRISKALDSEANWYAVNAYGGRQLINWSVLLLVIGGLYFIFPVQTHQDRLLNVLLAVAPILISVTVAVAKTVIYAKRL